MTYEQILSNAVFHEQLKTDAMVRTWLTDMLKLGVRPAPTFDVDGHINGFAIPYGIA